MFTANRRSNNATAVTLAICLPVLVRTPPGGTYPSVVAGVIGSWTVVRPELFVIRKLLFVNDFSKEVVRAGLVGSPFAGPGKAGNQAK